MINLESPAFLVSTDKGQQTREKQLASKSDEKNLKPK